jgi:hypothetical protein
MKHDDFYMTKNEPKLSEIIEDIFSAPFQYGNTLTTLSRLVESSELKAASQKPAERE